uniref:cytochrome-c oxidase n=1 Tax=Crassicauda sp. Ningbo-2019 TaxID=2860933 RepID=A0A8F6U5R9_9BILA|nr:cytochrome c oxidase subunit 2 [Crassicauda sp. Ningbo-2019]WHL46739.1 cytochrome c oxidase subunit 2 [Crassicauda magna]
MFFGNYSFPLPSSKYSFCYHFVHDHYMHIIFFSIIFMFFVLTFLYFGGLTFKFNGKFNDGRLVELFIEFLVVNFLILVVGPGFWLIHHQAHMCGSPDLNVKVVGHQWYWSYEYSDLPGLVFDSFMKPSDELVHGDFRLLEVDNRCVLPFNLDIGFYCTSADVIHSFCVPKCSFKMDVFNGLLSSFTYYFPIPGVYYGQCSELCGSGHSFMPIVLEVNSLECWKVWALSYFD